MTKFGVEEAIDIGSKVTALTYVLISAAVIFVLGVFLVKLLWAWTIPDLFPAAVNQGLIAEDLSWLAAVKAAALAAVLASTGSLVVGRWGLGNRP